MTGCLARLSQEHLARHVHFLASAMDQWAQHIEMLDELAVAAKIVGAPSDEQVVQDYYLESASQKMRLPHASGRSCLDDRVSSRFEIV